MDGGQIVSEVLFKHKVKFIFTLCGGHISPILVSSKQKGIMVIDVRNEVNAVFAADAVSRLSGIPGVAVVTAGPGVTNTITAIRNAQMAQSPLLLIGGASATILRGRGSLQDIDQINLIKSNVKWAKSVKRVKDIGYILTEAFKISKEGVPGPVFVELPIDLLYPEETVRNWYGAKNSKTAKSFLEKAQNFYIQYHLNNLFSGNDVLSGKEIKFREPQVPVGNSVPENQLKKISDALKQAKRPVILAGSQSTLDVDSIDLIARSLDIIGVPVYLSGMARGLMGKKNNLNFRHSRKQALKEADLVILAGVPCDFRLDYGNHISRKATLISVNLSKKDANKNRKADISLIYDPGKFICELAKIFSPGQTYQEWFKVLNERESTRESEIIEQSLFQTENINPLFLCREIEDKLENESIIVVDGGDFVATSSYILKPGKPLSWLDPGVFGTLGVGAGFALGAKLCRPEAEVCIIYGDGSSGYSLNEFDTFTRHKIGVIAVIGNDGCWSQIAREQIDVFKDRVGTVLNHTDYHIVAKGFGGNGAVISNHDQIFEVLIKAKESAKQGIPFLINAIIGKTDFRKGSVSV